MYRSQLWIRCVSLSAMSDALTKRLWTFAKYGIVALVLGYFGWLLITKNLKGVTWPGLVAAVQNIPSWRIVVAVALTVLNYVVLIGYDYIAVRYLQHPLPKRKLAFGSIIGYAFSHNFGWIAGGSAVRYRLYSSWGFSPLEIAKLIATLTVTFWTGVFFLAGVAFISSPPELPQTILAKLPTWLPIQTALPLGVASLIAIAVYLTLCAVWHKPMKIWGGEFTPPPFLLSVIQIVVASLDQLVAASIFYILLPDEVRQHLTFAKALDIYLLFTVVAALLHIPGGVIVLEKIVLDFIPVDDPTALTASLVVYRVIFYLLPLIIAGLMFLYHELQHRHEQPVAPTGSKPKSH